MNEETFRSPDPLVSASVYASGLLDDLLARALVPFWRDARAAALDEDCRVWIVRYSRGGEHLKVRLHAAERDRGHLARMLAARVEDYLDSVRALPAASPRAVRSDVPAIDPEDEAPEGHADRSLAWTAYRRSPVTLGSLPWLADDGFVARATQCLAQGCELVLAAIEAGAGVSPAARQKLAVKALCSGLGALGLGDPLRAEGYLRYHRDWLLRFFVDEAEQERQALQRFDQQLERMGATLEQLGRLLAENRPPETLAPWPRALAGLAAYLAAFEGREEYQVDPFATDVAFPPIFKVLHGLANQIGLRPLEEAYVHHLVLGAACPARR